MAGELAGFDDPGVGKAQEVRAIVEGLVDKEPESFTWEAPWSHGTIQHTARVMAVAEYASRFPGDFCEIGCMAGATTSGLGAIAKAAGKRVIAIDPWETGTQNCEGWEYEAFLENTAQVADVIDVLRATSQSREAVGMVLARTLCFAFVDGSHEYEDCRSDIMLVSQAPIVCVDDWLWSAAVKMAFEECAGKLNRQMVTHKMAKEAYLL